MSETGTYPRGSLKIYLGYAAGVGKTFQMLEEARSAKQRGVDIVIGYIEPHARPDTIVQALGLESIPRRTIEYRDRHFSEMDSDAVLRRKPQIAVVDELAHTNIPGSQRTKRWEDVQVLLEAGIEVWTTMNVQHIESLNDQIWQITGIRVQETVPDWVVRQAAEIVAIDVTPEALLNRLKRGAIYKPEVVQKALSGFFKGANLVALRELTLRQAAHEVDHRQTAFDETTGIPVPPIANTRPDNQPDDQTPERILIHITAAPSTAMLIRRGRRVADYLHADCIALAVQKRTPSERQRKKSAAIEKHLRFARSLRIETRVIESDDSAEAVVEFAHRNQITQIFVAHSQKRFSDLFLGENLAEAIVHRANDLQVTVVADRTRRQAL